MTHNQLILNHLKTKGPITPLEALLEYRCMRLGARIYDLRKLGYDIRSCFVDNVTADGEIKRYKQYWLAKKESA